MVEKSGEGSDDELAEHSGTEKTAGTVAQPIAPKKVCETFVSDGLLR